MWRSFVRSRGDPHQNFFGLLVLRHLHPGHEFSRLKRERETVSKRPILKLIVHSLYDLQVMTTNIGANLGILHEFDDAR
jgi:hypothetical protein